MCETRTKQRRDHDLYDRAGNGDPADGDQILDREMQSDTEHQQDDADFGELVRYIGVTHETRRERAHRHAREQIADERWQLQPARDKPADEGEDQSHDKHGEKTGIMRQ